MPQPHRLPRRGSSAPGRRGLYPPSQHRAPAPGSRQCDRRAVGGRGRGDRLRRIPRRAAKVLPSGGLTTIPSDHDWQHPPMGRMPRLRCGTAGKRPLSSPAPPPDGHSPCPLPHSIVNHCPRFQPNHAVRSVRTTRVSRSDYLAPHAPPGIKYISHYIPLFL